MVYATFDDYVSFYRQYEATEQTNEIPGDSHINREFVEFHLPLTESKINTIIGKRYHTPVTPTPPILQLATLVIVWWQQELLGEVRQTVERHYEEMIALLEEIATGDKPLLGADGRPILPLPSNPAETSTKSVFASGDRGLVGGLSGYNLALTLGTIGTLGIGRWQAYKTEADVVSAYPDIYRQYLNFSPSIPYRPWDMTATNRKTLPNPDQITETDSRIMVSPLLHLCQEQRTLGHNDPFYSIDFGSVAVVDSDGATPNMVGITAADHDPAKGIRIKADSSITFPLSNQFFRAVYTDRIESLVVGVQWSNWQNPGNEGVWQLMNNWAIDQADDPAVDPKNLCVSLNPRRPGENIPECQYMSDYPADLVSPDHFVNFWGEAPEHEDPGIYRWHFTYINFNTGLMQLSEDGNPIPVHFQTIYRPYDGWSPPTQNSLNGVIKPVRRSGMQVTAFRLRKGSDDYWVKRVRIFRNLPDTNPLDVAWRRVKDL